MEAMESIKNSGEVFYFWGQLCFFIRQDYEKVKDYTQEDISILQSIYLKLNIFQFFQNNLVNLPIQPFLYHLRRPNHCSGFVLRFLPFGGRVRVCDDACATLDV